MCLVPGDTLGKAGNFLRMHAPSACRLPDKDGLARQRCHLPAPEIRFGFTLAARIHSWRRVYDSSWFPACGGVHSCLGKSILSSHTQNPAQAAMKSKLICILRFPLPSSSPFFSVQS